jgi:hypothetical protein
VKGLATIPSQIDFVAAFNLLQDPAGPIDADLLVKWSQWCRLEPRLAELVVAAIRTRWRSLPPGRLNEKLREQPWPAAFGVLGEAAVQRLKSESKAFRLWLACVMCDIEPAPNELFFIGHRAFGGKLMGQDAEYSHKIYRNWGFLGRETLENKASLRQKSEPRTSISPNVRQAVLRTLLRQKDRLTTKDYIEALGGQIHPRQAERDLAESARLKPIGNTRGRWYRKVSR